MIHLPAVQRQASIPQNERTIYEAVLSFWRKHLRAPSQRELAKSLDVRFSTLHKMILSLRRKGLLSQEPSNGKGSGYGTLKPVSLRVRATNGGLTLFWE